VFIDGLFVMHYNWMKTVECV